MLESTSQNDNSVLDFAALNLAPALERAIREMGYQTMTPIQKKTIPEVMMGRDVMGAAQTGTGKTAAFSLSILQRLLRYETASMSPARHPTRALVLLPTRELADQVAQQIELFAKYTQLRSAVVFGGVDIKSQIATLKKGVEVLVATPGRLLDHIEGKTAILNQVEYVVLDEADRMLDIGFLPDLERILTYLPKQRTTLLFSATFSPEIKKLSASYLKNPVVIEVAKANATATNVKQSFFCVSENSKRQALLTLLKERDDGQAFIFCNSKLGCARLTRFLEKENFSVGTLHGDKSQDDRLKTLNAFKEGAHKLLVCTDVAARGLDIKDVPMVFNYDLPFNAEDYVHRIGRTGRAGASGCALSFVDESCDARLLAEIEKLTQQKAVFEQLKLLSNESLSTHEHYNSGQRHYRKKEERTSERGRDERGRNHFERHTARSLLDDHIFSRPYVPQVPLVELVKGLDSKGLSCKQQGVAGKSVAALLKPYQKSSPEVLESN